MKLSRPLTIIILMVVLAICTGILLSGCASTGGRKGDGPEMESPQQIDETSTAVEETSGSSPEVRKEPVASTGVSSVKPYVQPASFKPAKDTYLRQATSLKQGLDRILPEKLQELNWNRILTVLTGIVAISLIWGLAFLLARLPLRRPGAGRRGGGLQTGEQAREAVPT